jgi:hypothetical protein
MSKGYSLRPAIVQLGIVATLFGLTIVLLLVLANTQIVTTKAAAPTIQGLHVVGNQVANSSGQTLRLLGVNRSGTEYACIQGWGIFDGPNDANSVAAIVAWHTNAVRVPLNEDCWLGINGANANYSGANYQQAIISYVNLLNSNGLVAILDLHWSAPGTSQATSQQPMPDQDHAPAFWTSVATTFKSNSSVIFDLYNEPYPDNGNDSGPAWVCLRDGGVCPQVSFQVAGMQELVTTVRNTGATNIIMIGGVSYSNSLSQWLQYKPTDPSGNLVASWHNYNFNSCVTTSCWDSQVAPVLAQVPLINGELSENDCQHTYIDSVMNWLDSHQASYVAWSWNTASCTGGPALITDYAGTPTQTFGQGYHDHLTALATGTQPTTTLGTAATTTVPPTIINTNFAAEFQSQSFTSTTLQHGESIALILFYKNIGNATWTLNSNLYDVRIGTTNDQASTFYSGTEYWIANNRVRMSQTSVPPGGIASFFIPLLVPSNLAYGTYNEHYNLVNDSNGWHGNTPDINITINVVSGTDTFAGIYTGQINGNMTLKRGESAMYTVNYTNTGTSTWFQNTITTSVHLGTDNPSNHASIFYSNTGDWLANNRVQLRQASVAPGQNTTFYVTITVPNTLADGTYIEYFNLVAEGTNGTIWMNTFDVNVTVTVSGDVTPPAPLGSSFLDQDIGSVGITGTASYSSTTKIFTVGGSGTDVWSNNDSFNYLYQPVVGDGEIIAQVANIQNTDPGTGWSKAGVMIRQNTNPDSPNVFMAASFGQGTTFQRRVSSGGITTLTTGNTANWVRLVRSGNTFTGYVSNDGQNWTLVDSTSIDMGSGTIYVGLAVTAHNNTALNTATFSNVGITIGSITNGKYNYYLPFLASQYIPAGQATGFTSFIAFQNIGSTPANITIQYSDQFGNNIDTSNSTSCASVAANAECIPANPFPLGSHGTGIITSSQPLNVIVSEATPFGGSAYAVAEGSASSLIAPLAVNNAFGGYITQLTIYNGGISATPVTIQFYKNDGTHITAADQNITIPAYSNITLDQTAASSQLPIGFNGWAQITSAMGSKLVAQMLEQNPNSHFVAIANAQPQGYQTVYAPAVFNQAYGSFITGANIVNPGASPVNVSVTYYRSDGTSYQATPFSLAAYAVASIYQGATSGSGLPAGGLPNGFAGSAIVTVSGTSGAGVVMIVNENGGNTLAGSAMSGTYTAASAGAGAIGLPVMANGGFGYITGATILNTTNQTVSGSVQYYKIDGSTQGSPQNFNIPAYSSQVIYQGNGSGLPDGFYGEAVVTQAANGGSANNLIVTTNAISPTFFYTYTELNS